MKKEELLKRTQKFTIDVINLCKSIKSSREIDSVLRQLGRAAGSVGANYRAANRAKSANDFKYKINIVEEESDETLFWLEILNATTEINSFEFQRLKKEADELTAIFTAIGRTLNKNTGKP